MPESWALCEFKDLFADISSKPYQILQSQIMDNGRYPVISQSSNFIEGYSNEPILYKNNDAVIIFGDHTRNVKYVDFDFIVGADGVKILEPKYNAKYLYYCLLHTVNTQVENKGYSRHFSQLKQLHYPLPPLKEQKRLVLFIEDLFAQLDSIAENL